ncbi:hypothetical protein Glove_454g6 [Diversispora epigaea]|uniref:BACK domain-containing protein n=1 Tax=Diversispora epigaea TaxID=1348612 RepID=A0A397GPG2_9GLOM|nr:hypothetical protein Glove_454g6 [Diversispora epigaea]
MSDISMHLWWLEKLENSFIFDLLIKSNELELDELTSCKIKNFKIIQDFCNDIISKHPNTIFESENFLSLPEDVLISIIIRDNLKLEEGKVWERVIQWGKAKNLTLTTNLTEWTSDNFLTLKGL